MPRTRRGRGSEVAGRLRLPVVAFRQAVDLVGIEDVVELGEHHLAGSDILGRGFALVGLEGAELDDRRRLLALPNLRAKLLGLPVGEPVRGGIPLRVGLQPEQDDVDAAIGLATDAERKGGAAAVAGPRLPPRRRSRLDTPRRCDPSLPAARRTWLAWFRPLRGGAVRAFLPSARRLGGASRSADRKCRPAFPRWAERGGRCPTRDRASAGQPDGGAPWRGPQPKARTRGAPEPATPVAARRLTRGRPNAGRTSCTAKSSERGERAQRPRRSPVLTAAQLDRRRRSPLFLKH